MLSTKINDILKISDKIQAKIIRIDDRGRIDLSLKQAAEPPQTQPQQHQKFVKRTAPVTQETKENFRYQKDNAEIKEVRENRNNNNVLDYFEMRESFRENNPEDADSFEKKIASFLKVSDAKITDLNTRNSARSGRSARRRNSNRDH